jgi:hypothetical protein
MIERGVVSNAFTLGGARVRAVRRKETIKVL